MSEQHERQVEMSIMDRVNLKQYLAKFIRNEGLSPRRLELVGGELLTLLRSSDAREVYGRILSALDEMDDDQYTQALRNAFGIGKSKRTKLSERRAEWIEQSELDCSEDTVRRWEKRALDVLGMKLAGGRYAEASKNYRHPIEADPDDLQEQIDELRQQLIDQKKLLETIIDRLPPKS